MDPRPSYRVGAAGLDPRDWRLIEIVFKHSQYNRYEFTLIEDLSATPIDILIVNTTDSAAVKVAAGIRASGRPVPIIAAVPRGAPSAARHAISIDRLTLQLLPILNRVVELELSSRQDDAAGFGFLQVCQRGHASRCGSAHVHLIHQIPGRKIAALDGLPAKTTRHVDERI